MLPPPQGTLRSDYVLMLNTRNYDKGKISDRFKHDKLLTKGNYGSLTTPSKLKETKEKEKEPKYDAYADGLKLFNIVFTKCLLVEENFTPILALLRSEKGNRRSSTPYRLSKVLDCDSNAWLEIYF